MDDLRLDLLRLNGLGEYADELERLRRELAEEREQRRLIVEADDFRTRDLEHKLAEAREVLLLCQADRVEYQCKLAEARESGHAAALLWNKAEARLAEARGLLIDAINYPGDPYVKDRAYAFLTPSPSAPAEDKS